MYKLVILFTLIYLLRFHILFYLIFARGIIKPNKFGWFLNDILFPNHTYTQNLESLATGTHYINLYYLKFRIINDIESVNYILSNSNYII